MAKKKPPEPEGEPVDFITDVYRRVVGHLPLPNEETTSFQALTERITPDPYTPITQATADDLEKALRAAVSNGWAEEADGGYRMTEAGLEGLRGPAADPNRQPVTDG